MIRDTTIAQRQALLAEALEVLEREYAAQIEVDDVARRLATSRRQLQRCFAEHGDGPFRECLARIRMRRAAELLQSTSLPVREVAHRVGYRQPAQFAKAFARHHGTVPSRFRASRSRRPA
ncbi:MAG TPA: helix-turn-helix transcriptional regulator [Solirubrobacteraceae bacterium]|jgi:transcriptional regulator GlxA family with amidase domain